MNLNSLISENIIENFNIIRKTYRWLALICLIVFWSIFIKESSVNILGLEIESNQISIVLYILITGTSLYIIARFKKISILLNQLDKKNSSDTLFRVIIHNWLLNPFSYQTDINFFNNEDNPISVFDIHRNSLKILFIPFIHIFMTLVLSYQQRNNFIIDDFHTYIKFAYIISTYIIIGLLQYAANQIDKSFKKDKSSHVIKVISKNQSIRNKYIKVAMSLGMLVYMFYFFLGYNFTNEIINLIKALLTGNFEIVE